MDNVISVRKPNSTRRSGTDVFVSCLMDMVDALSTVLSLAMSHHPEQFL